MCALTLRLLKDGKDLIQIPEMRAAFVLELIDNGKTIISKRGWNMMNISHLLFRANQGLPDVAPEEDPEAEVKHNYVLQATFDLSVMPEFAHANE